MTISLAEDTISHEELESLSAWILAGNRLTKNGETLAFEAEFEEYMGVKHAIVTNSGSSSNLLMIYALLAIPFRSYMQPLIIMAVIPFGIIGALIGHLLLGLPLGVLSMFGMIALSGVIVNGSLILIDFINENLRNGMSIEDAILTGAKSRFRPIMLTSLTTFLGVAPITFETSLQAQFLIPMSASLGFGVLFGAIILQLLIPALTMLEYLGKRRFKRFWRETVTRPAEA